MGIKHINLYLLIYHRSFKPRYPTELRKGIERMNQSLEIYPLQKGIKTYANEECLPYMKDNLKLLQPDFAKIPIPDNMRPIKPILKRKE